MQRPPIAVLLAAGLAASMPFIATAPAAAAGTNVAIVTTAGTIDLALDPVHAPLTTKNFLAYVDKKFYDGGTFFRAVPGFVIQGGNKTKESPGDVPIKLETPAKTGLKNLDGSIAMARTLDPDSATSEFFIDDGPQARLDGTDTTPGYAVFGHVTKGMDVVKKIVGMPAVGEMITTPVKIITIKRIK